MKRDIADFVVVGSGAAGATAALVLAEAGREVIVLEEGPAVRDEDRGLGAAESFMRLFRDRGTQVAMGRSVIPVLQGGAWAARRSSTAHHLAPAERRLRPQLRRDRRGRRHPARRARRAHGSDRARPPRGSRARPPARRQRNAHEGRRDEARVAGHAIRRNVLDCQGSGRCLEACPTRRKQSMEVTYLPRAVALGARVLPDHEVRTVDVAGTRATACRAVAPTARRFTSTRASASSSPRAPSSRPAS